MGVVRPEAMQDARSLERIQEGNVARAARWVYLLVNFVLVFNYTFVILDSDDLCATLGMSQGDSGRMVGNYMLGFCPGAFIMWYIARQTPGLWKSGPRRVLAAGLTFQLLGAATYAVVAFEATGMVRRMDPTEAAHSGEASEPHDKSSDFGSGAPAFAVALLIGRFISGMGSGLCQQFYVASMLHLTPVSERPEHTTRWVFSGMLAIGAGPMAAAGLGLLRGHSTTSASHLDFTHVGFGQIAVVLCAFGVVFGLHPDLEAAKDEMETEVAAEGQVEVRSSKSQSAGCEATSRRIMVVCGCLIMANLRAFGISAVEVVTASLLEDEYGWKTHKVGVVIGLIFLCCVPLRAMHMALGSRMPVNSWIRTMGLVALLGCCLLFRGACAALTEIVGMRCAGTLVLAGVILFPTFYMGEALACGIMHQHVLPHGSRFDGNHSQLWYNLAQGAGRFLGPWLSRWATEAYGQNAFAMQQMAVTCVFLVVFERCVRPNTRSLATSAGGDSQARGDP